MNPDVESSDSIELYNVEFSGLFNVIDKTLKYLNVDRKEKFFAEYRVFAVVTNTGGVSNMSNDLNELRTKILLPWSSQKTFEQVLSPIESITISSYVKKAGMKNGAVLRIREIYEKLKEAQVKANLKDDDTDENIIKIAPEIFRLHLARILNMIENDDRLISEIKTLENYLRTGEKSTSQISLPPQLAGLGNMMNSFIPGGMGKLQSQFAPHLNSIMSMAPSLLNEDVMSALSKGDFKKAAKRAGRSLKNNKEFAGTAANIMKAAGPTVKHVQGMFKDKKIFTEEMEKMEKMGNLENADELLDKAIENLDLDSDEDEEIDTDNPLSTMASSLGGIMSSIMKTVPQKNNTSSSGTASDAASSSGTASDAASSSGAASDAASSSGAASDAASSSGAASDAASSSVTDE